MMLMCSEGLHIILFSFLVLLYPVMGIVVVTVVMISGVIIAVITCVVCFMTRRKLNRMAGTCEFLIICWLVYACTVLQLHD